MQHNSLSLITVALELTSFFFFLLPTKLNLNHHTLCTQLELTGQLCISPHNSKARDNKLIAGLKFRPRSLRPVSDLNTAAVR